MGKTSKIKTKPLRRKLKMTSEDGKISHTLGLAESIIVKMTILLKAICMFNAIPKIPVTFRD
jgi:hypothetical protein